LRAGKRVCIQFVKRPQTNFNISFATPTSLSTNHTLDNRTLVKASHTTKHLSRPIMPQQEPPVPTPANLLAAVKGMTAEGNTIAQSGTAIAQSTDTIAQSISTITQSAQAYNAHQHALNTELSLYAGYNFAGIHQQLAAIQASIVDSIALNAAQ
jgi:hypothetical protein